MRVKVREDERFERLWMVFRLCVFIPTISDSISIQGIGLQLPEMHNVLYGKRILRGRMPQQSHS